MMNKTKKTSIMIASILIVFGVTALVLAAVGDLLGTVTLPGNPGISVGGTFDGTYYMTTGASDNQIDIYSPPAGGNGVATLVSSKTVLDGLNNPVTVSALAWDPGRNKVWGAYGNNVYLIDIGDPTVSGNALATWQFNPNVGGIALIDGLAYDASDDTLYHSPDVNLNVYHFAIDGTLLNTVTPKNAAGQADGRVSGVTVGAGNTLYIGRDGDAEIRRVDKTTGAFVSQFATTSGRVEDLTCDPVTYNYEAILAKDAYNGLYEAFEVEEGTCPLPEEPATKSELIAGQHIEVGLVEITNDDDNVYVKYTTDGDWVITELHLHIADELVGVPQTKKGNPKVGHFEFGEELITPVTEYEFTKSIAELEPLIDDGVVIAAHAVVYNTVTEQEETAWADTLAEPFPGNNWAMYFVHELV